MAPSVPAALYKIRVDSTVIIQCKARRGWGGGVLGWLCLGSLQSKRPAWCLLCPAGFPSDTGEATERFISTDLADPSFLGPWCSPLLWRPWLRSGSYRLFWIQRRHYLLWSKTLEMEELAGLVSHHMTVAKHKNNKLKLLFTSSKPVWDLVLDAIQRSCYVTVLIWLAECCVPALNMVCVFMSWVETSKRHLIKRRALWERPGLAAPRIRPDLAHGAGFITVGWYNPL